MNKNQLRILWGTLNKIRRRYNPDRATNSGQWSYFNAAYTALGELRDELRKELSS